MLPWQRVSARAIPLKIASAWLL